MQTDSRHRPWRTSLRATMALMFAAVALLRAGATEAQPSSRTSVSVDVSELDDLTFDRIDGANLEKQVVLRLIQSGFAVVSPDQAPDVRVVYRAMPGGIRIQARAGTTVADKPVEVQESTQLVSLHLELAHKTLALVRQMPKPAAAPTTPRPSPAAKAAPAVSPQLLAPRPVEPAQLSPAPRITVGGAFGLIYRGATDPLAQLHLAYPWTSKLAGRLQLGLIPSRAAGIDVFEWQTLAAVTWSPLPPGPWQVELGVGAGAFVHHYSLPGQSGNRVDPVVAATVALVRRLTDQLQLGVCIAPGFTARARTHTQDGTALWQRSGARLHLLAGLSWQL